MKNILIIGTGGFLGAVLRYIVSGYFHRVCNNSFFPVGTLGVNLLGCFFIGILGGWSENLKVFSAEQRLFLFLGLLGSFTTFSTFGYETFVLLRDQETVAACMNIFVHLLVGIFAVWAGYTISTI